MPLRLRELSRGQGLSLHRGTPDRDGTPDGHPSILAVNALAPFILTALIDYPDRLVYLSSSEHHAGPS